MRILIIARTGMIKIIRSNEIKQNDNETNKHNNDNNNRNNSNSDEYNDYNNIMTKLN